MKASPKLAFLALAFATAGAWAADGAPAGRELRVAAIPQALHTTLPADKASASGNTLTLEAAKGTDLFVTFDGKEAVDNTARALFQPQGDFILSARVAAGFTKPFDGAALVVYADRTHWAKLLFEQNKPTGTPSVTSTVASGAGDDAHNGFVAGDSVYLKVVRKKDMFVFYTSADGKSWTMVRTFGFASPLPLQVGFFAQAPDSERYTGRFSEIRYRAESFKDYWQGE